MKKLIKYSVLLLGICCFVCCKTSKTNNKPSQEQWVNLLKDNSLKDWTIKVTGHPAGENYKNTFVVENGILKVNYDEYDTFDDSFGHIFYNKEFSNYRLRLQYRFTGKQIKGGAGWAERNSGVMIHSPSPKSMLLNQKFPLSIEVQLLGGIDENVKRPTGNLCTPGTHVYMDGKLMTDHCMQSNSKTYHGEQWVTLEIIVQNDFITHKINGETVISYSKPQIGGDLNDFSDEFKSKNGELLKSGYISLQSESHPVEFKNIEILILE